MMPKSHKYIMAAELSEKPYTEPPAVTKTNRPIYFSEETMGHKRTALRGVINIIRNNIDPELMVFCNTSSEKAAIRNEDVLTWYKERQLQFPMLSHHVIVIF